MSQKAAALVLTFALALSTAGCWSDGAEEQDPAEVGAQVSYEEVPCPERIAAAIVGASSCGYLHVPETRDGPGDGQGDGQSGDVRVFVTRIAAPEGVPEREPIVVAGVNIAATPNYGGISPLAQRTGREVIIVTPRGVGISEPSLECPEVEDLNARFLATSGDATTREMLLDAIAVCHNRLIAAGVDVGAYTFRDQAADLLDLRLTLGIDTWSAISYGTSSRVVEELLRRDADAVRSVMVDSPGDPGQSATQLAARTPGVIRTILAFCANDADCVRRHPDPEKLLRQAQRSLADQPIRLTGNDLAGDRRRLLLDEPMLMRILRQATSDGGSSSPVFTANAVPGLLVAIRDRSIAELSTKVASIVIQEQPLCMGYQPQCALPHDLALGVLLTITCSTQDLRTPAAGPRRTSSPYEPWDTEAACGRWDVESSATDAEPEGYVTPAYVVAGELSTYTPTREIAKALPLADPYVVIDPYGGHNVISRTECLLDLRNTWIDTLTPADPPACLNESTFTWEF